MATGRRVSRRARLTSLVLTGVASLAVAAQPAPAHAEDVCPITRGAFSGAFICEYTVLDVVSGFDPPDPGQVFTILTGSDHAVCYIFQRFSNDPTWSGWFNAGGFALSGPQIHSWPVGGPLTIRVIGTNGGWWCNTFSGVHLTGWFGC